MTTGVLLNLMKTINVNSLDLSMGTMQSVLILKSHSISTSVSITASDGCIHALSGVLISQLSHRSENRIFVNSLCLVMYSVRARD